MKVLNERSSMQSDGGIVRSPEVLPSGSIPFIRPKTWGEVLLAAATG